MTGIDLHTHSSISDGALSPRLLVKQASEIGLSAIAIADHDTVDGIDEALKAGIEFGIEVISAVELSVDHETGSMHLLGYFIDFHDPELLSILNRLKSAREVRNLKIISYLNELGYSITVEEVLELSPDGTYGRAHIGQALMRSGEFRDMDEIFDKLLGPRAAAYYNRFRLPLREAIRIIHSTGGLAVWAHPGLHENKLENMLARLKSWHEGGLDGIESDYFNHSLELRDRLRNLAVEYGMIYTGGSDFHGSIKPQNKLGCGPGGLPVGPECLAQLKDRRKAVHQSDSSKADL